MAVVWIPSLMRNLTGGQGQISAPGKTVREVIDALEEAHPGIKARLCDGDRLNPALSVYIDGQLYDRGLSAAVGEESEIHFLPAVGGG
jgi:molybdopterin synthase sulfur carrier subunit